MNNTPVIKCEGIDKKFHGVYVLKDVDFDVKPGEVHALMGENGAGKSTLIKIITGVYPKDGGQIYVDDLPVEINSRSDASRAGIAVIYQELSLIPTLSVTENVFLGQEKMKGKILLSRKEMKKKVSDMIEHYHFNIKADDIIENLGIASRQTVEIMKALIMDAKLIIMDEPTASLNTEESEILFEIIRNLKKEGKSIIYISHRLEEVYAMSDRLTVLRNGKLAGVLEKNEIEPVKVIRMMLGKDLIQAGVHEVRNPIEGGHKLEVKDLKNVKLKGVNFAAYAGQVLGIGGLVGSGRTETLRAIFGLDAIQSGEILFDGNPLPGKTAEIMRAGVGLVPEDRHLEGLVLGLTVERNIALASYDQLSSKGFVKKGFEKCMAEKAIHELDIRPSDRNLKAMNLSGGNQQKIVLAKWLQNDLKVLMVDEPTVGIDVGAKSEIYDILRNLADKGSVVIVVSSDMEELLKISDRILVMVDGRVFKELRNENLSQEDILIAASGLEVQENAG